MFTGCARHWDREVAVLLSFKRYTLGLICFPSIGWIVSVQQDLGKPAATVDLGDHVMDRVGGEKLVKQTMWEFAEIKERLATLSTGGAIP